MQITFDVARALSILAFCFFGATCLITTRMVEEFERYRLARFRRMVGVLELVGAIGMLAGYVYSILLIVSAAGLTTLMLLGVVTRIRIGDSLLETLPAIVFFVVNAFILAVALWQA
tara:strand:- start:11654 stop:12001 length:348 start_codon:yes stop_codon:yes gene_type:complete